jgi:hypothetical protein
MNGMGCSRWTWREQLRGGDVAVVAEDTGSEQWTNNREQDAWRASRRRSIREGLTEATAERG